MAPVDFVSLDDEFADGLTAPRRRRQRKQSMKVMTTAVARREEQAAGAARGSRAAAAAAVAHAAEPADPSSEPAFLRLAVRLGLPPDGGLGRSGGGARAAPRPVGGHFLLQDPSAGLRLTGDLGESCASAGGLAICVLRWRIVNPDANNETRIFRILFFLLDIVPPKARSGSVRKVRRA